MNNPPNLQEKLQALWNTIPITRDGNPVTNLHLDATTTTAIEQLTRELEEINPNPQPLLNAIPLLDGAWQLRYSTAREILSLDSLPLGFKVGQVYQVINVANKSFFNLAFVKHHLQIISGHVKVTANFEPARENLSSPNQRINVYFDKRYLSIANIWGIPTPQLNPFKVVAANNPVDRLATLDITYLDENCRIGRGGDGSLFILTKCADLPANVKSSGNSSLLSHKSC